MELKQEKLLLFKTVTVFNSVFILAIICANVYQHRQFIDLDERVKISQVLSRFTIDDLKFISSSLEENQRKQQQQSSHEVSTTDFSKAKNSASVEDEGQARKRSVRSSTGKGVSDGQNNSNRVNATSNRTSCSHCKQEATEQTKLSQGFKVHQGIILKDISTQGKYIFIQAPPRFRTLPSPKTIGYLGLDTRLTCDIVGYPKPTIIWQRANKLSMSGSRFMKRKTNLIISNTSKEDGGSYMCRASENQGKVLDSIFLEVKPVEPIKLINKSASLVLVQQRSSVVRLSCAVSGAPLPTIEWTRNGSHVTPGKIKTQVTSGLVNSTLLLTRFTPGQSHKYSCVVRNRAGQSLIVKTSVEWRRCDDPGIPNNGYRTGSNFFAGNYVTYLCNHGYTSVGPGTILCQLNGQWTKNKPLCKRRCDNPGNLPGGFRTGNDLWEGKNVTFHCFGDFYYIKGSRELTCLSNGTWSSTVPSCEYFAYMESAIFGGRLSYAKQLQFWLQTVSPTKRWQRCWHGNTHGFAASTFHSRCDNKGPTVTIVRVDSYMFGGFTDQSWEGPTVIIVRVGSYIFGGFTDQSWGVSSFEMKKHQQQMQELLQ